MALDSSRFWRDYERVLAEITSQPPANARSTGRNRRRARKTFKSLQKRLAS